MVDWYEKAKSDSERLKKNTSAIKNNIETLYDDLWNEIVYQVKDLQKDHALRLYTNGAHFDRVVGMPDPSDIAGYPRSLKNELHLNLTGNTITATTPDGNSLQFTAEAGNDDVVHLTHNGAAKTMQGAAIMILRRFLFPNLFEQA